MSKTVEDILRDPHRGMHRAQGILCYLFRHAMAKIKLQKGGWDTRSRLFFAKPHNKDFQDQGNLNKTLTQDDFTWGGFKRAVDFLNPVSAVFQVTLTWRSGKESVYSVVLDPAEDESDESINTFGDVETPEDVFRGNPPPASTLARLFRHIIRAEGIDLVKWNALFEQYINNPNHGFATSRREVTAKVNALQRELLSPRMSWNVFRQGIIVLNPVVEDYQLILTWGKDAEEEVTVHQSTLRDPLQIKPATVVELEEDEIPTPPDENASDELDPIGTTPS